MNLMEIEKVATRAVYLSATYIASICYDGRLMGEGGKVQIERHTVGI